MPRRFPKNQYTYWLNVDVICHLRNTFWSPLRARDSLFCLEDNPTESTQLSSQKLKSVWNHAETFRGWFATDKPHPSTLSYPFFANDSTRASCVYQVRDLQTNRLPFDSKATSLWFCLAQIEFLLYGTSTLDATELPLPLRELGIRMQRQNQSF